MNKSIDDQISGWKALFAEATSDVKLAKEEISVEDSGFNRRGYVRSVFALFEVEIYQRKEHALSIFSRQAAKAELSWAEAALLREEQYRVEENGSLVIINKNLDFKTDFRFSTSIYSKVTGISYKPDFGGEGWQDFKKALLIRHRITHPKSLSEMTISDSDMDCVLRAITWFFEEHEKLYAILSSSGRHA